MAVVPAPVAVTVVVVLPPPVAPKIVGMVVVVGIGAPAHRSHDSYHSNVVQPQAHRGPVHPKRLLQVMQVRYRYICWHWNI